MHGDANGREVNNMARWEKMKSLPPDFRAKGLSMNPGYLLPVVFMYGMGVFFITPKSTKRQRSMAGM